MGSVPPEGGKAQTAPLEHQEILPSMGVMPNSEGKLVPYEYILPLIEARVGQVKAEFERDFGKQLLKIDHLPTMWQLVAALASAIVVTITLLFTVMSYFGDRQDSAVDRSATVAQSLQSANDKLDRLQPREETNGK